MCSVYRIVGGEDRTHCIQGCLSCVSSSRNNLFSGTSCCVCRMGKMGAPWGWYGVEECMESVVLKHNGIKCHLLSLAMDSLDH